MHKRIILASASPRRRQLLEQCGISFEVMPANIDEANTQNLAPADFTLFISKEKAKAVAEKLSFEEDAVIIAADTIVVLDNEVLGKPADEDEAFLMLQKLQGKQHSVYTGITVGFLSSGGMEYIQDVCQSDVTMYSIRDGEILEYIKTKEPLDKAGSYAVQGIGRKFIERVDGDFNNVVGLSTDRLKALFKQIN